MKAVALALAAFAGSPGVEARPAREYSVVGDPRNVLPLRLTPRRTAKCALHPSRQTPPYWLGESMRLEAPR
jgi:hypothetical protein